MARRRKTTWTNPILTKSAEERSRSLQNRIADAITEFAGSMPFVYLHIVWFAAWIGFGVETLPLRAADDDRVPGGHLPVDVRDDQPEPRRREARVARGASMAVGPGGGAAERGAHHDLTTDPGAHEGDPFADEGLERGAFLRARPVSGARARLTADVPTASRGLRSTAWRRDVRRTHDEARLALQHPDRALLPAPLRPDDGTSRLEVLDDRRDQVSMAAQEPTAWIGARRATRAGRRAALLPAARLGARSGAPVARRAVSPSPRSERPDCSRSAR